MWDSAHLFTLPKHITLRIKPIHHLLPSAATSQVASIHQQDAVAQRRKHARRWCPEPTSRSRSQRRQCEPHVFQGLDDHLSALLGADNSRKQAVGKCPCRPHNHGKNKACHISQCVTAVSGQDPDALYRTAKKPCPCGFVWPECTDLVHIRSVDCLAAVLSEQEKHTAAFSTALGLIRLDPTHPIVSCLTTSDLMS